MTSLVSVQLAIDLATRERDKVLLEVGQAKRVLQSCQDQFNQLSSYAQETQARWVTSSRGVATPAVMHHYYQFMDKLHHAMAMQTQVLQEAGRRVETLQVKVLEAEFKLASRQTLCDSMRLAQHRWRDKLEQKQVDEMAALQHRRNLAGHHRPGDL